MKVTFCDTETYPNYHLSLFLRDNKWYAFEIYNDKIIRGKIEHLEVLIKDWLVTYNGNKYDIPLIKSIIYGNITNEGIYNKSQDLINNEGYYDVPEKSIDLQSLFFAPDIVKPDGKIHVSKKSLKHIGVLLEMPKLQELPIPFNQKLTFEETRIVGKYCMNDVYITEAFYNTKAVQDLIGVRKYIQDEYNIYTYSLSDSSLCNKLIKIWYGEENIPKKTPYYNPYPAFNDAYSIHPVVFKTKEANDVLNYLLSLKRDDEIKEVELFGIKIQYGYGGIHSVDEKGSFYSTNLNTIIDFDLDSEYPTITINKQINPPHLENKMLKTYESKRDERIALKKKGLGKSGKANSYKLVLNSYVGKMLSKYSFLYYPLGNMQVCFTGQLMVTEICELLYLNGFEILSCIQMV